MDETSEWPEVPESEGEVSEVQAMCTRYCRELTGEC